MTKIVARKRIAAPLETVFRSVAQVDELPDVYPEIVGVELLTPAPIGQGTRFRETRKMGKREMVTELEVTEWAPFQRVRMVTESHGTVWDTIFALEAHGREVELSIEMDARSAALPPKMRNFLFSPLYRRGIEKHLDAVKAHCERAVAA